MSCGDHTRPVNPERPGESGQWVAARTAARSMTGHIHTWQHRNALGIVGGPTVTACTGCGESHYPTWVPAAAPRRALPAAPAAAAGRTWPYIVGEAEWADLLRERGAA